MTDDPVDRELERGLRFTNLLAATNQQNLLDLGAQVSALLDELEGRGLIDRDAIDARRVQLVEAALVRARSTASSVRVELGEPVDKYEVGSPADLDCEALFPICRARCCAFNFALTTQDLDEGVVKWDHGRPYLIRQSAETGRCVHQDVPTGRCGVYQHRPGICRRYDCRNDKRIWLDFANRVPAPLEDDGRTHLPMAPGRPPTPTGEADA